jgi:hypothetical protein
MYSGQPTFILHVRTTMSHTISGVVQILQSETPKVSNSQSPKVLDKDG